MTVLEDSQIALDQNADLDEILVAIDSDAVGFRMLDFDTFFQNDKFVGVGRSRWLNERRKFRHSKHSESEGRFAFL